MAIFGNTVYTTFAWQEETDEATIYGHFDADTIVSAQNADVPACTVTKLWVRVRQQGDFAAARMAIYDASDPSSENWTVEKSTSEFNIPYMASSGWISVDVDWDLTAGKKALAFIGYDVDPSTYGLRLFYDPALGAVSYPLASRTVPDEFDDPLDNDGVLTHHNLCMYAEYTTTESDSLTSNAHIGGSTVTTTVFSNALIIDPHIFTFADDSSVTSIVNNYNAFDIKLKHACNHNLNAGQYTLNTCPRCVGKGYYYDIKFNATGKPIEVSLSDKLAQTLEKFVLTENNDFHPEVAINIQQWLGSSPISEIKSMIKFKLSKSLLVLMETQRGVLNLSSEAQIARIDSIEVFENPNDSCTLDYTVTITTVAGNTKELTGTMTL